MNVLKHITRDMKEAVRKLTILLKEGGEFRDIQLGIKRDKKEDCDCCCKN